jgi:TolA-binding protein
MRSTLAIVLTLCLAAASARAQEGEASPPTTEEGAPPGEGAPEEGAEEPAAWPRQEDLQMPEPGQSLGDLPPPPWADTTDVPNPEFLDTTDRRMGDERPPPSAEQVQALRELEAELDRFGRVGIAYRENVNSILRREFRRRRRERQAGYARQIEEEERAQNEARDRAIRLFEAFIRRYPNEPTYTPDAMFRLGELYYERSSLEFQDLQDRGEEPESGHPDFRPTVLLYRALIDRFPEYRRLDGVYYLIGYCLNEMGEVEDARIAWLSLVCANRFTYPPPPEPDLPEEHLEGEDDSHPALTLDGEDPYALPPVAPFVNPYEDCQPVVQTDRFINEVWLRIGEYHFDFDFETHGLDRAIAAYQRILSSPEDRNYNLALYKLAWSYYRASRYPEAIEHFALLINWSDEQERRTGRAGSELRAEALTYLGITFAYDDWDENQIPDIEEGQPRPVARVQDPTLLPQDRPWTVEVYFELGQVLFEEAKYADAIEVWEMALARFPNHRRAPEVVRQIARAHQRANDLEAAVAAEGRLREYGPGSEWWNANGDHPEEQTAAERMAEGALVSDATRQHEEAQSCRRIAVQERDVELLDTCIARYNAAAEGYRAYLERYPNSPNAYELQFNLADALYWSGQYEEAARVYAAVRDSNLDDTYLAVSARMVVQALQQLIDEASRTGELVARNEAPTPEGSPPRVNPTEMPVLVQRMAQAREVYLARISDDQDRAPRGPGVRPAYDYNNALLLYFYGYWPQARDRFLSIYEYRCSGENADETGEVAWESLRNMAIQVNDRDEVERLALDLESRGCTFDATITSEDMADIDAFCEANPDHPRCTAIDDRLAIQFQRAIEIFSRAEEAEGDEQRALYEQAATQLFDAVNAEPDHPDAPRALLLAASALERTQRFDSAGRLYQRVIDEVGPLQTDDPERQAQLDGILGTAYFRLAYTANRFFDYDRAVENYMAIADSRRFARSQDADMPGRITDALVNAARILEYQQQYSRARTYYRRAADALTNPEEVMQARFQVAEMAYQMEDWNRAIRDLRSFIGDYSNMAAARERVVTAYWRIAEARLEMRQQRERQRALQDVVDGYQRVGGERGSIAAEYAAHSRFLLVDPTLEELEDLEIDPGRQPNTQAFVQTLNRQIQDGSAQTATVADGYNPILAYGRPEWTVAALTRQGRAYEILARAVLNASFRLPDDLARQLRGVDQFTREEIELQFEDTVRDTLNAQVRPIECFAVARYVLAARAARRGNLDTQYSREAIDRLQEYGEERIAECITEARAQDSSYEAYQPNEFARARRGMQVPVPSGVAAPPLDAEPQR